MDRYTYSLIRAAVVKARHICSADRGPFAFCQAADIVLNPIDGRTDEGCLKGFYQCAFRVGCITYNANLPDGTIEQVLWHEIGHSLLHHNAACPDTCFLQSNDTKELQANLFSAEFQLRDAKVKDALLLYETFERAAMELSIPKEILDFKLRMMGYRGFRVAEIPTYTLSNYLRGV